MTSPASFQAALNVLRDETGIVIPVYFPQGVDTKKGESLLADNVTLYREHVSDPASVCLSVDGKASGEEAAKRIAAAHGVSITVAEENRGKLGAAANGVRVLKERKSFKYYAIIDQDGDHFANELLNFVRAAEHIIEQMDGNRVLVLGRRISRHRPMGLLRGELEELCDRVLLDALQYHAAVSGSPLRLEYATSLDEYPDFHSGYKLLSSVSATDALLAEPKMAGVSEDGYYRHAVEAVITVEALVNGAAFGVVNRTTLNEQPISTFGQFNRIELASHKIIWPCKRLAVPANFVTQWMNNHIPRLLLNTLAPEGKRELEQIRETVATAFGESGEQPPLRQPLFV